MLALHVLVPIGYLITKKNIYIYITSGYGRYRPNGRV